MKPFGSAEAFASYAAEVIAKRQGSVSAGLFGAARLGSGATVSPAAAMHPGGALPADILRGMFPSDGRENGSDTSRRAVGVDWGDVIKGHGDHLIVLRRGRLFSIDFSGGSPKAVGAIDVVEPQPRPSDKGVRSEDNAWYDELLVDGDIALVIGYSYATGGKEIRSFSISPSGQFQRVGAAVVRAQHYSASRNYLSQLINHVLVMYVPIPLLQGLGDNAQTQLPAQRRAEKGQPSLEGAWTDLIEREHLFRPIQATTSPVVHAVLRCDVREPEITCTADAALAPSAQTFYVSTRAVYVWVAADGEARTPQDSAKSAAAGVCYRIPLNGSPPTAARVWGQPLDGQSFSEQPDGTLQVLVQRQGGADGMWRSEWPQKSALALATLPWSAFSSEGGAAQPESYRLLPGASDSALSNRFVGRWLLYGAGLDWFGDRRSNKPPLYLVHLATGNVVQLPLSHGADRIDPLGIGAVITGARATDLALTTVALNGDAPAVVGEFTHKGGAQSDSRTQGLVFQPTSPAGGLLGLALVTGADDGLTFGGQGLGKRPAKIRSSSQALFLEVADLKLRLLGTLTHQGGATKADDHCQSSCADWHDNARALFWRGRVMALLGYELLQGEVAGGRLQSAARLNFWEDHPMRKQLAPKPLGILDP